MALKDQKDVLIAWINGETIQIQLGDNWLDCDPFDKRQNIAVGGSHEYRIKPKKIVTSTCIERDVRTEGFHVTYSSDMKIHNLRLTWSEDGKTLIKAEVI
jgi:hypothetical protein